MRHHYRLWAVLALSLLWLLACPGTIAAGDAAKADPISFSDLVLNGDAFLFGDILRLTPTNTYYISGSAWLLDQQPIRNGFTTEFRFKISEPTNGGADGFAFVIQNSAAGLGALGGTGFGVGYGNGDVGEGKAIENSLAIEFDTWRNTWDPNANHIAVQSCGTGPNTANHDTDCLVAIATPAVELSDGNVHTAKINYCAEKKVLSVRVDGSLVLRVSLKGVNLRLNGGLAWVGFTASTGGSSENHDIVKWWFYGRPIPIS